MNVVEIDIEELKILNITPNSYVLAHVIHEGDSETYKYFCFILGEDTVVYYLYELYKKGFLDKNPEVDFNYMFDFDTLKVNLFNNQEDKNNKKNSKKIEKESLEDFYNEFYNCFPKGVTNGGNVYVKSNKKDVETKLDKFLLDNKKISKEDIIKAAKKYVDRFVSIQDYTYMKTCSYFIKKENVSVLLTECENLGVNNNPNNNLTSNMRII